MAPPFAGDGGDQRREAAYRCAFAVAKRGVEAQRREPAAREPPGVEVALGVGAADGAAPSPETARRFGCVVPVPPGRGRRSRQGEEGPGLVEGRAQRRRARPVADEVEQVAVDPLGCIGPFSGCAGRRQADEQGSAAGAVKVARHPVAALAAAMGQVAAADILGATPEGGGGLCGVHGNALQGRHGTPGHGGTLTLVGAGRRGGLPRARIRAVVRAPDRPAKKNGTGGLNAGPS